MSSVIVKELVKGQKFTLYQVKHRVTGRIHYKIKTDSWAWRQFGSDPTITMDEVRKHFNPTGGGASRYAYSWKFRTREAAEKLLMIAILRWGA